MSNESIRILVVDDDRDIVRATARLLERAGYAIACAQDGAEALVEVARHKPDLMLLDRDMPKLDGLEVCRRLKQNIETADCFVVLASGSYVDSEQQAEGLESGADGYLTRPIENRELLARVAAYVRVYTLTRALRRQTTELQAQNILLEKQRRAALNVMQDLAAERDRAEQSLAALRESEARFRSLVEGAPDAIFVQTDARFAYLNAAACALFGASAPEPLVGQPVVERFHPGFREIVRAQIARLNNDKIPAPLLEEVALRLDGAEVPVEVKAVPIVYEGRNGALVFAHDITTRKQAQVEQDKLRAQFLQAQKMESIGRLAGGVAHDFNNMLTGIMGHVELCREDLPPDHPMRDDLDEIMVCARRSADLTRQLLAFARKQTIDPVVLDVNDTVSGMLKMLRRLIGEDIDLAWLPGAEVWPVKMDKSQMQQILTNLAVNARDAIKGVGRVTIETRTLSITPEDTDGIPESEPGDFVVLAFSDNGCGIDKQTIKQIFEPFFTTKQVGEGTGLGLATVYGILKQNRGFIHVYSEVAHGSTFRVYLPRHQDTQSVPAESQPTRPQQPCAGSETLLVVEDDAGILGIARRFLESLGYTVLASSAARRALKLAEAHPGPIDLLLTDVVMPDMNGRELSDALSAKRSGMRTLFMSGYSPNVIAHRGVLDDGLHYIAKPFSREELGRKVREMLDCAKAHPPVRTRDEHRG